MKLRQKKILLLGCLFSFGLVFADSGDMAQDILKQVIHGPVNTNPDLSDYVADSSVILSLKSATLNLACTQKNNGSDSAIAKCIKNNKSQIMTLGDLSESSFAIGQQAAKQQAQIHREVTVKHYFEVVNYLMRYTKNLELTMTPNTPDITGAQ